MRRQVSGQPLRRPLRWTRRTLLACAVILLGYCIFVVMDGWIYQSREDRRLDRLLHSRQEAAPGVDQNKPPAVSNLTVPAMAGDLIGRIEIPRLHLSVVVVEGISGATLRRAVGHIPGTALPGGRGNVAISGHRDTFFRPLRNIQRDDIISLTTLSGEYRYRVVSTSVVGPTDIAVLNPVGYEVLTLVTCYPFYFVGPAPSRFIVRAERITDEAGLGAGHPRAATLHVLARRSLRGRSANSIRSPNRPPAPRLLE